jgi:hypothetical protein
MTPKLHAALTLLADLLEGGGQVLVFSNFHAVLDALGARLAEAGVPFLRCAKGMTGAQRGALAKQFKQPPTAELAGPEFEVRSSKFEVPRPRLLLATLDGMANGHSFPRVAHLVKLDRAWAWDINTQVDDRIHRLDSLADATIWELETAGSIDAVLRAGEADKGATARLLLDGIEEEPDSSLDPRPSAPGEGPAAAAVLQACDAALAAAGATVDEAALEAAWPALRDRLRRAAVVTSGANERLALAA